MNGGTIVTFIISTIVFGYGAFGILKSVKKMLKRECIGYSECNYRCNKIYKQ